MEGMEKQLTAINWLVDEINKLTGLNICKDEPIIEQAKEMEKRQMLEVSKAGCFGTFEFEQYYNETFKSEQNGKSKIRKSLLYFKG